MKYCGIKKANVGMSVTSSDNVFNPKSEPYRSLGDSIQSALEYGSDIGSPATVQFDSEDSVEVDVLTDPNHDFFDIAEQYGEKVSTPAPPPVPKTEDVTE